MISAQKGAKLRDYAPCNATIEELATSFTGKCHSCGVPEAECSKRLSMDHCHETGAFRGWLCGNCNFALGQLKSSFDRTMALAKYIERASVLTFNL